MTTIPPALIFLLAQRRVMGGHDGWGSKGLRWTIARSSVCGSNAARQATLSTGWTRMQVPKMNQRGVSRISAVGTILVRWPGMLPARHVQRRAVPFSSWTWPRRRRTRPAWSPVGCCGIAGQRMAYSASPANGTIRTCSSARNYAETWRYINFHVTNYSTGRHRSARWRPPSTSRAGVCAARVPGHRLTLQAWLG